MDSVINLAEEVENKDRMFGSQTSYYPAIVRDADGNETPALFTADQVLVAKERAARNPEDIPEDKTFWARLFGK